MAEIPAAWAHLPFFREAWPGIEQVLAEDEATVLPPETLRFAALEAVAPEEVGVVILGQDPYPTAGHANGLAFSVQPDVRPLPRSLANIYAELEADVGARPANGDLSHWAAQGVLLLNTALSVREGDAGSHARLGWDRLAREVLAEVSTRPTAFVLWGRHAQGLRDHIRPGEHLIVESVHPSPLSARRGFFGSRPFSHIDAWRQRRGLPPIRWA